MRFAFVAGAGWLLDAACLVMFSKWVPIVFANVISSLTAAAFVYLVAHRHVHRGRPSLVGVRLGIYAAYTLLLVIVASFALGTAADVIRTYAPPTAAVLWAKVLITPPQFIANFLISRVLARARFGESNWPRG